MVLSACSFIPEYQRPALPTAQAYPGTGAPAQEAAPPLAQWPAFFGDPELRRLIERSLVNNRDLRIAVQRVAQARAAYGIQRSEQFPTVDLRAGGIHLDLPDDLALTRRNPFTAYNVNLGLSWELDLWGRVRSLKEAALQSYLATDDARRAITLSLMAQVANAYLNARELDERIELAERTLKAREESFRIARRRFEVGSGSRVDAVQAETLFQQARTDLAVLQRARDNNANALTLLVGEPVAPGERPLTAVEPGFAADIPAGLPSDLLANRPDVLAAERRLVAANANIGAARAAFFPQISLTAAAGAASSELGDLFSAGTGFWLLRGTLAQPIFNAGRNRANLDLSEARKNEAVADYERTVQVAFREVADALADRKWLREQIAAQEAALAAQVERARLADVRYRSGTATYLEVVDAERDRFTVEQSLVQTRRILLSSGVNLYSALGGAGLQ